MWKKKRKIMDKNMIERRKTCIAYLTSIFSTTHFQTKGEMLLKDKK